jgi:hypothetical protein
MFSRLSQDENTCPTDPAMKPIILVTACCLLSLASANEKRDFPIENIRKPTNEYLSDKDWKLLQQGRVPGLAYEIDFGTEDLVGFTATVCPRCSAVHLTRCAFQLEIGVDTPFLSPDIIRVKDACGMVIRRGRDRAIEQIRNFSSCYFFERNKTGLHIKQYWLRDCSVATDDCKLQAIRDAIPAKTWDLTNQPSDTGAGTRAIRLITVTGYEKATKLYLAALSMAGPKSQLVTTVYKGSGADPTEIEAKIMKDRTVLKEGSGYKTTTIKEELDDNQALKVVSNSTVTTRCDPDRKITSTEEDNLTPENHDNRKPPEEKPEAGEMY